MRHRRRANSQITLGVFVVVLIRSVLVDRAVQSELTTKAVAENCLALTVDVVQSAADDDDEDRPTSPNITRHAGTVDTNHEDAVSEEFQSIGMTQRRDSYLHAIMHADSMLQHVDVEEDLGTTTASVTHLYLSDGSTGSLLLFVHPDSVKGIWASPQRLSLIHI